jgi:hypothetical protein
MQSKHTSRPAAKPSDKSGGKLMAHTLQRKVSGEKRAKQSQHTGALGQVLHTAHWLGSRWVRAEKPKRLINEVRLVRTR